MFEPDTWITQRTSCDLKFTVNLSMLYRKESLTWADTFLKRDALEMNSWPWHVPSAFQGLFIRKSSVHALLKIHLFSQTSLWRWLFNQQTCFPPYWNCDSVHYDDFFSFNFWFNMVPWNLQHALKPIEMCLKMLSVISCSQFAKVQKAKSVNFIFSV